MDKDKAKARAAALEAIRKKFGTEIKTAADTPNLEYEVIHSGTIGLDKSLGIGGYPKGRVIEIYGKNASGKTSLTLHAIAECQKEGGLCAFIDAEQTFDPVYASGCGVNLETLDLSRPDNGEEALEIVDTLTRAGAYDLIIVDSVAALVPTAELDGDMGKSHVALQARLMSQALRKLVGIVSKAGTMVVFLNQTRANVGVMFGSSTTTSGGEALGFYSSVRLKVARIATLKEGDEVVGNRTRVTVEKNKCSGTAKHSCEFDMYSNNKFGCGISHIGELFEYGVNLNLIEKAGAWYSYKGERLGQGKLKALATLEASPETVAELETLVQSVLYPEKVSE